MNDRELLSRALLRPRRYQGFPLTFTGEMIGSAERVEDDMAQSLRLTPGDAVVYQVLVGQMAVDLFAQDNVADWMQDHWSELHRVGAHWTFSGTWIFGITWAFESVNSGTEQWMPACHFGLLLDDIPVEPDNYKSQKMINQID